MPLTQLIILIYQFCTLYLKLLFIIGDNLVLDYKNAGLMLKSDSGLLDGAVGIGNGPELLKANYHVKQGHTA